MPRKARDSLVGRSFGEFTVLSELHVVEHRRWDCVCLCSCGERRTYHDSLLRTGKRTHCGHVEKPPRRDYTGYTLGKVTVCEYREHRWRCTCVCGTEMLLRSWEVYQNEIRSCGCLRYASRVKHGLSRSSEYRAWRHMRDRCCNEDAYGYANYGGRGITICDRWLDFASFYADMGPKPSPQHSLDRLDPNGNYEPSNCRWATREEQDNNRRDSLFLEFAGQRLTISQWAARLGKCYETLRLRHRNGWTSSEVLFGKGKPWTLM